MTHLNLPKTFLYYFLILGAAMFQACDRDRCENVICNGPESYCVDGFCVCPQGYEGPNCDILSQDKYIGSFFVSESCNPGQPQGWTFSSISPGFSIDKIIISNFLGIGRDAEATVNGNFVTIPNQTIGSYQFSGNGSFIENANRIEITYEYYVNGTASRCTAYLSKQ